MKKILGSAFLGAAYRVAWPLFSPTRVRRTIQSDSGEKTKEYRDSSVIGGAIRGALAYLFLKGAGWGLGKDASEAVRRYGDGFVDYIADIREEGNNDEGPVSASGNERRRFVNNDMQRGRGRADREILDDFFGGD